jgi:hypothetical protein
VYYLGTKVCCYCVLLHSYCGLLAMICVAAVAGCFDHEGYDQNLQNLLVLSQRSTTLVHPQRYIHIYLLMPVRLEAGVADIQSDRRSA